jgi:hypothetical protein
VSSHESKVVPSARPIVAKEVPLVDRTEEMNVLKEAIHKAAHGEGGIVLSKSLWAWKHEHIVPNGIGCIV